MAAVVSERAMAQQPLHPFFTGQHREIAILEKGRRIDTPETEIPSQSLQAEYPGSESDGEVDPASDIEQDPNYERRKRRRTVSPVQKTEDGDVYAQHGQNLPRTRAGPVQEEKAPTFSGNEELPMEDDGPTSIPRLDGISEPKPKRNGTHRTPSKTRMLQLRADGKLRSPSSRETLEESKGRRKRRSGGNGRKEKHLVLKYGRTPHERLALGRKIEQIMSEKFRVTPRAEEKATKEDDGNKSGDQRDKETRFIVAAAATHPFFRNRAKDHPAVDDAISKDVSTDNKSKGSDEDKQNSAVSKTKSSNWPASFGSSFSRPVKLPGSLDPIWPPADMQHVRGFVQESRKASILLELRNTTAKKLKGRERVYSATEKVFQAQKEAVGFVKARLLSAKGSADYRGRLSIPKQLLMTGRDLQSRVREGLTSSGQVESSAESLNFQSPAASVLFQRVRTSFAAFDRLESDSQDWCHKYAPSKVSEVLQDQDELILLRDWLRSTSVDYVHTGSSGLQGKLDAKKQLAAKRRKRKIRDELDDFIVSSEEEVDETEENLEQDIAELNDASGTSHASSTLKRLKTSNIHKTRAVLLSGPHGCGKTASIYAVAAELGFEVFEINSGTRRNGRDIMDRVGDMTRNHLVRNEGRPDTDTSTLEHPITDDVVDEKQKSVTSFFTSKGKSGGNRQKPKSDKKTDQANQNAKVRKRQKQSLILLEEVDVLFEDDKPFWSAVFTLIVQSRRPIIMTCSEEQTLPLEEFVDTSVIHLAPQLPTVISEYLICLAANEGHLLSPAAVNNLVSMRKSDLRGALSDLQFWCQMAVGDEKHGITWFMEASAANKRRDASQDKLRIVSLATCREDSFILDRKQGRPRDLEYKARLLSEANEFYSFDPAEFDSYQATFDQDERPSESNLARLQSADLCYDTLSASDTWTFSPRHCMHLDPSQPEMTSTCRSNYVDDYPLLQTDVLEEQSGLGAALAFSVRASCCSCMPSGAAWYGRINRKSLIPSILDHQRQKPALPSRSRSQGVRAFTRLSESQEGTPWNPSRGPGISVFHGPFGVIASEVAPLVRGIALYDLKLEEERKRLSSLMDVPGRQGKRQRKTRASRAALEGGNKANTRRERWWSNGIDYRAILNTADQDWTKTALCIFETQKLEAGREENAGDINYSSSSPQSSVENMEGSADELA